MLHRLLFNSRNTVYVLLCSRPEIRLTAFLTVVESPVLSERGVQIGLLRLTVTLSVVDTEAGVQQAMDANAEMASAPIDPTAQLPSGLSDVADTAKRLDFESVLARLDGFMKIVDLAAEVCRCCSATLQRWFILSVQVHPLVKLAWGVVSVAYKVRTRNENYGDQRVCGLILHEGCQTTSGTRLPHTTANRGDGREL